MIFSFEDRIDRILKVEKSNGSILKEEIKFISTDKQDARIETIYVFTLHALVLLEKGKIIKSEVRKEIQFMKL